MKTSIIATISIIDMLNTSQSFFAYLLFFFCSKNTLQITLLTNFEEHSHTKDTVIQQISRTYLSIAETLDILNNCYVSLNLQFLENTIEFFASMSLNDAFELWCWRRFLRVLWTARRSNQFILNEISPEYSLEGLMLKLKLQYFGHLM